MAWLITTLAAFTAMIAAAESACWILFRRKMEPLRFPSANDPTSSHSFYLKKLRIFAVLHCAALCAFVWIFCIVLWW